MRKIRATRLALAFALLAVIAGVCLGVSDTSSRKYDASGRSFRRLASSSDTSSSHAGHDHSSTTSNATTDSGSHSSGHHDDHGSHEVPIICETLADPAMSLHWSHYAYLCLLWLVIVLLIGTLWNLVSTRCHVTLPYTSGMMIFGIALGAIHRATDCQLGLLSISIHQWTSINSHVLLFVFLPLLLLADSMSLKLHLVKKTVWQFLLLAIIGVVIGTILTAVTTKYVLAHYEWSWEQCFMFGSILSATDPVAVVGLLKSLGASPVLTMQIAGESLFNDGVAIVLFNVFYALVISDFHETNQFPVGSILNKWENHSSYTVDAKGLPNNTRSDDMLAGYIAGTFAWMFFFAAAWGIFIGGCFWALIYITDRPNHDDSQMQITFTIILAFMAYVVGEGVFAASGVISTVFAGIVMAGAMWPSIVKPDAMEHVWHCIEFILNTVLFALAGTIIGAELVHYSMDHWFTMLEASTVTTTYSHEWGDLFGGLCTPAFGWIMASFPNETQQWFNTNWCNRDEHYNCKLHRNHTESREHLTNVLDTLRHFDNIDVTRLPDYHQQVPANYSHEWYVQTAGVGQYDHFNGDDWQTWLSKIRIRDNSSYEIDTPKLFKYLTQFGLFQTRAAGTGDRLKLFDDCTITSVNTYYQEYMPGIIQPQDVGWMLVLYLLALIIRAAMLGVLYFPLKCLSKYGTNVQHVTFMWWGGLRGAVGLALAMTYYQRVTQLDNQGVPEDRQRIIDAVRMLFHVGFIALLTLLINAPTSGLLMRKLGIVKDTKEEEEILRDIEIRLNKHAASHMDKMFEKSYNYLKWMLRVHREGDEEKGDHDARAKSGEEQVTDRLLRRLAVQCHAMVVGLDPDGFLETLEIWRTYYLDGKGSREAALADAEDSFVKAQKEKPLEQRRKKKPNFDDAFDWFEAVNRSDHLKGYNIDIVSLKERAAKDHLNVTPASRCKELDEQEWRDMEKNGRAKLKNVRKLFLNILQQQYWAQIEDKEVVDEDGVAQTLLYTIDQARDRIEYLNDDIYDMPWTNPDHPVGEFEDWQYLKTHLDKRGAFTVRGSDGRARGCGQPIRKVVKGIASWCGNCFPHTCGPLVRKTFVRRQDAQFEMLLGYIRGHIEAQKILAKYVGAKDHDNINDEADTPEEHLVILESQKAVDRASIYFSTVFDTDPESQGKQERDLAVFVVARKIAKLLIFRKREEVELMEEHYGLLTPNQAHHISADLDVDESECDTLYNVTLNALKSDQKNAYSESTRGLRTSTRKKHVEDLDKKICRSVSNRDVAAPADAKVDDVSGLEMVENVMHAKKEHAVVSVEDPDNSI